MPRSAPRFTLLVFACLLLGASTALANPGATPIASIDSPLRISTGWQAIRTADGEPEPGKDDTRWSDVDVGDVLEARGASGFAGVTWLRNRIELMPSAARAGTGIAVGPVDYGGYSVSVNGAAVGGFGPRGPGDPHVVAKTTVFWLRPESAPGSSHVDLVLRVWRDPAYAGVPVELGRLAASGVEVGRATDLETRAELAYKSALLDRVDVLVLGIAFILAGLYHLQLFRRRHEQTEYLWFGAIAVCASINMIFSSVWGTTTLDPLTAFYISRTAFHVAGISWLGFVWKIFGWKIGRLARAYVALQLAILFATLTAPAFVLVTLGDRPVMSLAFTFVLWFGVIPVMAYRGHPEARTICVGLVFLATARLWQMLGGLGFVHARNFVHWGFFALLLSVAVSLSNRFSRVYRDLDALNQDLEEKVSQRTRELADTIDQLRESERIANESRVAAQEASESKSLFLASMSHELRTPLNAILGFVQLLGRRNGLNEETRHGLSVIMRSGEHLLSLINDILSITKIEARQMTLKEEPFDLHRMLDDLSETFQMRAEAKGLLLKATRDADVPRTVCGDDGKLRQILINLLGNAIRYTSSGTIELHASWSDDTAVFTVRDTGYGIADAEKSKLFVAFSQTASGLHAKEGTGLGLAISRANAQLMGGDITVESAVGVGTTFVVKVRLRIMEYPAGHRPRRVVGLEPGHPEVRVLVVDDVTENRHLLSALMSEAGFTVCEASTGRDAISKWELWKPDIIWMDIRMAGINGIEATRAIRERERENGRRCVIIALTASAFDTDRQMILEAGCDDFVPKPFLDSVIFARLEEHLGVRYAYEDDSGADSLERGDVFTASPLDPEALSALPPEWLDLLDEAVQMGDAEAAIEVVSLIAERDEPMAAELRRLVRAYRFDDISDALGAIRR